MSRYIGNALYHVKCPLSANSALKWTSSSPRASNPRLHNRPTPHHVCALFLAPANICFKKVKIFKKNTTYGVRCSFWTYPAGEFLRFDFKLPRFQQLLAVYIITLKKVIWFPRREATAALPLISWTPSAPLWRRLPILTGKQGNLSEEALETKLWDWTGLN